MLCMGIMKKMALYYFDKLLVSFLEFAKACNYEALYYYLQRKKKSRALFKKEVQAIGHLERSEYCLH